MGGGVQVSNVTVSRGSLFVMHYMQVLDDISQLHQEVLSLQHEDEV